MRGFGGTTEIQMEIVACSLGASGSRAVSGDTGASGLVPGVGFSMASEVAAHVACQQHGTTLRGFLPRAWDHSVASYGTTRRVVPGVLITGRYGCLQVDRLGGSEDGVPGGCGD